MLHFAEGNEVEKVNGLQPKDPYWAQERDFPCIPILGMGLEPSILFDREVFGFLRDRSKPATF